MGCGMAEELIPFRESAYTPLIGVDVQKHQPEDVAGLSLNWNIDIADINFPKNLSCVLAINVLHFLNRKQFETVLPRTNRSLVSGGLLVISSYHSASDSKDISVHPFTAKRYELALVLFEEITELANHPYQPGFDNSNNGLWVFRKR